MIKPACSIFDSPLIPRGYGLLQFGITTNFMLTCYCIGKCFKENILMALNLEKEMSYNFFCFLLKIVLSYLAFRVKSTVDFALSAMNTQNNNLLQIYVVKTIHLSF